MKEEIILIGGGGHCKSCIDVIEKGEIFSIAGIVDVNEKVNLDVLGYKIFATDEELPGLVKEYDFFLVTLGQIKIAEPRKKIFSFLKGLGANLPVILSPRSSVAASSSIDEGTIVMHDVIVNSQTSIGKNCILNNKSCIEHDVHIGDHCHISTAAIINGNCTVDEGAFIGSNSVINNGVYIGKHVVIGAGSVVIHSIEEAGIYAGNPAEKIGDIT
ncbi:MAG: acetyltransferase [Candidatus Omnitrophica bacterium]|nr:acetyltransferase [Candidatus Omnitrophota bacterium]